MAVKKNKINCCKGKYHVLMDDKYYCMAPPNIDCSQLLKDIGTFTRGDKKIFYCEHHQHDCPGCTKKDIEKSDMSDNED